MLLWVNRYLKEPDRHASYAETMDFTETFTVAVGEQQKSFTLHKCLATKTSDFFASALNGSWKEAIDGAIKIPETHAEVFHAYIHWLYTREIPLVSPIVLLQYLSGGLSISQSLILSPKSSRPLRG